MKIEKVEKFVAKLNERTEYFIQIRILKQTSKIGVALKKVHRVIKFDQNSWLKPYIDLNTNLRKASKSSKYDFKKDFFKIMLNSVFGKTVENGRKYRGIKLVTTEWRRNYLVSEPNYPGTEIFT